jgi:hypothetical protein
MRQMPCWPDIWERVKAISPLLGGLALLLVYFATVVLLLWAPKVRTRPLRIASRILGATGAVPMVIVLPAILFGFALTVGNSPAESRVLESLDGQQAMLSYDAGFLGRDYTKVSLKDSGCCRHTTVFWHFGPSALSDPKLEWPDNHHLRITYHARPDDPQECEKQVGQVTIVCTSVPW